MKVPVPDPTLTVKFKTQDTIQSLFKPFLCGLICTTWTATNSPLIYLNFNQCLSHNYNLFRHVNLSFTLYRFIFIYFHIREFCHPFLSLFFVFSSQPIRVDEAQGRPGICLYLLAVFLMKCLSLQIFVKHMLCLSLSNSV